MWAPCAGLAALKTWFAGVFCNCIAHALTTEKEEIMGLLLGDSVADENGEIVTHIWKVVPQIRKDRRKVSLTHAVVGTASVPTRRLYASTDEFKVPQVNILHACAFGCRNHSSCALQKQRHMNPTPWPTLELRFIK